MINAQQEEVHERLVRIESKLSALMAALGYDRNGLPVKKSAHPESLFTQRRANNEDRYLTRY